MKDIEKIEYDTAILQRKELLAKTVAKSEYLDKRFEILRQVVFSGVAR